jgi:acyl-CoA synthetase (AMP-forming)/AMP-acid ligase II
VAISLSAPTEPGLARLYRDRGWWRADPVSSGLETVADEDGTRLCVVDNSRSWTYSELRTGVERAVGSLRCAGVGSGDPVVIVAPISAEAVMAVLATIRADGVVVVLDRRSGALDVANAIRSSGARVVVAPAALRAPLRLDEQGVTVLDLATLDQGPRCSDWAEPDPAAPRLVIFTSGTTDRPKGVVHTLETFGAGVRNFGIPLGFQDDDRLFLATPISTVTGMVQVLLATRGASIVLEDRFDARSAVDRVEQHGVTVIGGAPLVPEQVLREFLRRELRPSTLRCVTVGGTMIPRALLDLAVDRFGIEPVRSYGSSEVPSHTATSSDDPVEERLDDDGRPREGGECALGQEVGGGHELLVRGPNMFQGYLYDEDNDGVIENGWFRTGDVVETRGGRVRVLGRLKETAVRKGLKISLAEVDITAERLPYVVECAAYAVPDEETGERISLALRARDPAEVTFEGVVSALEELGLARGKLPEEIVIWAQPLPRNPSGKVIRAELGRRSGALPHVLAPRLHHGATRPGSGTREAREA